MNMEGRNPKYAKYWSADGLHHCSPLRMAGFACNNLATNMYFMIMAMASFYLNGFVGLAVNGCVQLCRCHACVGRRH